MMALGACLFIAYAYFYQAGGWNENTRFALVRAIVEQGTLRIDDTVRFDGRLITGDLAHYDGHLYCDKAPGLSLLAVLPVAVVHPLLAAPTSRAGIATLSYVATVFVAGLPALLSALLLFSLAETLGATRGGAALGAGVFGLGTPAWCYATLFIGHALATAGLVTAFAAAVALREPSTPRRDWILGVSIGVSAGWATITEYPSAIPAAIIALLALARALAGGATRGGRVLAGVACGALPCAAVLMLYNQAAFGGPLTLGYTNEPGFHGMREGFLGVTYPKPDILVQLLLGRYRGLLPLAPVVAAAPLGFVLLARNPASRAAGITAAVIAVFYLLFNAAYFYWDGGWSYGPRHMAPALPFLCLALAPLWSRAKTGPRVVLSVLAVCGVALALMAVATTAQPSEHYKNPVPYLLWPNFTTGRLSINYQSFVEYEGRPERDPIAHAWNLGEKLGLSGLASLVPLLVAWGLVALAWWMLRNRERVSG